MSIDPIISIIVATSANHIIGRNGDMPWKLSSDLKRFKALTMGHPVIMGRKTFESIGKPLPGRLNIVVTRNHDWESDGVLRVSSLPAALDLGCENIRSIHAQATEETDTDDLPREVFIIGGGEIYRQALALADVLYVTHIDAEIDGDTAFPAIDEAAFEKTHEEAVPRGERDSHATRFVIYERPEDDQA
ncbi:MAG: dihydrofolate reductase [Ahrensia sp.]